MVFDGAIDDLYLDLGQNRHRRFDEFGVLGAQRVDHRALVQFAFGLEPRRLLERGLAQQDLYDRAVFRIRRCFFQAPYSGRITLRDRSGNTLDMVFDKKTCRPSFAHNGKTLVTPAASDAP